jgi:alkyl hydroperoxide reductase subunit AhpC
MASLKAILTLVLCSCALPGGEQSNRAISPFVVSKTGGGTVNVQPSASRATVVVFVSALCPISLAYADRLTKFQQDFSNRSVRLLLVNSNENEPDSQVEEQRRLSGLPIPVHRDPHGKVAEMLGVFATPTAVVLDENGMVRYQGAIDNSRNPTRVTKQYVRLAVEAILEGGAVVTARTASLGCSIKRSTP